MTDKTTPEPDAVTLALYQVVFEFEPRVGLTFNGQWLSWHETVALAEWLAPLVKEHP